jgi:Zinc knuckle
MLLVAANTTCYNCGKTGHMANKCPNHEKNDDTKEGNGSKRTLKKCLNCNIKRHFAKDWWFKVSNKEKHPAGFKIKTIKSNEVAAAAIDNNNNLHEYLFGTLDDDDIISDPI